MTAKVFTLVEARATLPKVKALMHVTQQARGEILRLCPEVWPVLRAAASNGGSRAAGELFLQFQRLEQGVKGMMALGVTVKDVDEGLVDFLGKRNGREVYLCWQYGEDDIDYWHDLSTGFDGRHPIDGQIW